MREDRTEQQSLSQKSRLTVAAEGAGAQSMPCTSSLLPAWFREGDRCMSQTVAGPGM